MDTPWISFRVDLSRMPPSFWLDLGEVRSKCEHLANVPLPPQYATQLHTLSLTKGAHATTAIEGNTLTEDEVAAIVRIAGVGVTSYPEKEVANVVRSYNEILDELLRGDVPNLSVEVIQRFNREVLEGLELQDEVRPGKIREHSVVVGPYRAPNLDQCAELLGELCDWLNSSAFLGDGTMRIPIAVIKAALAHLYLAWIHPFGDGNGRTARLCEFLVLVTSGVPTSTAHLISNHCNETRDEYYRQLRYATESGGDTSRFLSYAVAGFVRGLTEQLDWVYERQFRLTWDEYVLTNVTGRDAAMRERRKQVASELLFRSAPVTRDQIPELSPALARTYARTTPRTLARDLEELVSIGLLRESAGGYEANSAVLVALLPTRVSGSSEPANPIMSRLAKISGSGKGPLSR